MIKNIMNNIGTRPTKANFDSTKLRSLQKWLPSEKYKEYVDYIKKNYDLDESLTPEDVEETLGGEKFYSDIIMAMPTEKVKSFESDYAKDYDLDEEKESKPSLEEVTKAKNDRIAELSKAHPNEWAMNGHNTDFDRIVDNDPVMKKLDSYRF